MIRFSDLLDPTLVPYDDRISEVIATTVVPVKVVFPAPLLSHANCDFVFIKKYIDKVRYTFTTDDISGYSDEGMKILESLVHWYDSDSAQEPTVVEAICLDKILAALAECRDVEYHHDGGVSIKPTITMNKCGIK